MKKILVIIMVLAVLLSLAGCKKTGDEVIHCGDITSSTTSEPADEVVLDTDDTFEDVDLEEQQENTQSDKTVVKETPINKKEENKTSSEDKKTQEKNEKPTENKTEEKAEEKTEKPKEEPIEKKEIKTIIDESHKYLKTGNVVKFYEANWYEYFAVSGEKDGIIIYFEDGTTMGVVEAFQKKMVTLSDLDKFGVKYIKNHAGMNFFDLTEYYDCDVENKTQEFYRDENFSYFFPSQKDDYVKYVDKNGKTILASEALKKGIIKHYHLGNFIDFDKKYIGNKLLIVNESEGYFTTQAFEEFYRDDNYKYEFSSGICVMVYYPDGSSQGVTEALKSGKIKVTDLNGFGIKYYKRPIGKK